MRAGRAIDTYLVVGRELDVVEDDERTFEGARSLATQGHLDGDDRLTVDSRDGPVVQPRVHIILPDCGSGVDPKGRREAEEGRGRWGSRKAPQERGEASREGISTIIKSVQLFGGQYIPPRAPGPAEKG